MKKKKIAIGVLIAVTLLSGCASKKEEVSMDDNGKIVTVDSLKKQVDELEQQVKSMQKTVDQYYAGSIEGKQEAAYQLEDISYQTVELEDGVLAVFQNNGSEPVIGLKVLASFYDAQNNLLTSKENYVEITTPGAVSVSEFDFYSLGEIKDKYDHVELQLSKEDYSFARTVLPEDNFTVEVNQTETKDLTVKVTNKGDVTADVIQLTAVFYKGDQVIGYNTNSMINLQPGNYDVKNLYGAYAVQDNGNTVPVEYDSYKVYLSSIYEY